MTQQRTRPGRRYPSGYPGRTGEERRDPYLFLLSVQIALCILLVAAGWGAKKIWPEEIAQFADYYGALLTAEQVELSALPELPAMARDAIDQAADSAARAIENLLTPEGAAQQPAPAAAGTGFDGGDADQSIGVSSVPSAQMAGELSDAGGWMGNADAQEKSAPDSCALSPIYISAQVEPPTGGKVTSLFGWREHPISGSDDFHRGLDIAAAAGSGIYAALPGRVIASDFSAIYGNFITLDHGNGLYTTYCHCESIAAPLEANLRRGELVATVGSTGISSGPHVHFEVSKDGRYYNPAWVLDGMGGYGI